MADTRQRSYNREYYEKNKERIKARNAAYVAANRDKKLEYYRQYNAAPENARRRRDRMMQRTYGISLDEYERMLSAQGGGCAVCGNACPTGKRLAVDHSHTTGRVRGLLCANCNRAAGLLTDSSTIVKKLAEYLDHHEFDVITPTGTTPESHA